MNLKVWPKLRLDEIFSLLTQRCALTSPTLGRGELSSYYRVIGILHAVATNSVSVNSAHAKA